MAEVWLAERADGAFERRVAIKLLFDHPSGAQRESFAERFSRERDILASLNHPHIAALHDAGVTPSGQPWLALEYVEGETITRWCDTQSAPIERRIDLFRQVLVAVEHAHANLVIHRDLKPSNILVTSDGTVKLLDFGIAKLAASDGAASHPSDATRSHGWPMTPQYASPEQMAGAALGTSSDVYSLGVVLYELLCGQRPYDRMKAMNGVMPVDPADPPAPSRWAGSEETAASRGVAPATLVRLLRGDLDAVAGKAVRIDARVRYGSTEALRGDLDRWRAGLPVHARPSSLGYRLGKFHQRHRLGVWLAGAASTTVVGLAITATMAGLEAQRESKRAIASRDFVTELFRVADPEQLRGGELSAVELLNAGRKRALEGFAGQPVLQADVLRQIGIMQGHVGDLRGADLSLTQAATLLHGAGDRSRDWLLTQIEIADNAFRLGDHKRVATVLALLEGDRRATASDPALAARYWSIRGGIARTEGRVDVAIEQLNRAAALAAAGFGPDHADTIDVLRELADSEVEAGRFDRAEQILGDAAARAHRNPAIGRRDVFAIDADLAITRLQGGHYRGIDQVLRELLQRCDADLGARNDYCGLLSTYRTWLALRLDDATTRREMLPRLLAAAANSASPWRQAGSANLAAETMALDGGLDDRPALLSQVRSTVTSETVPARDRIQAAICLSIVALRARQGNDAERWAERAIALQGAAANADRDLLARAKLMRGVARQWQGRSSEALLDIESAVTDLRSIFGPQHPLVALYRANAALPLRDLGRLPESKRLLQESIDALAPQLADTAVLGRLRQRLVTPSGTADNSASRPGGPDVFL